MKNVHYITTVIERVQSSTITALFVTGKDPELLVVKYDTISSYDLITGSTETVSSVQN